MKQMKFLVVALTILMGTMVTSCMDGSEPNTIVQGSMPMRVKSLMFNTSFISGGLEIVPNNSSLTDGLSSSTKVALVTYQYDYALQPITENTKKLKVDLLYKPTSLDAPLNICSTKGDGEDVESTHAVATLSVATNNGYVKPYVMPVMKGLVHASAPAEYYLIAPVGYKIKSVQKEEDFKAEISKHAFTLVMYTEEIKTDDTSMVVYLRHVITEAEKTERSANNADYKAFDLTQAIYEFRLKSGKNPTKVIVKAMENSSSDELKGGNEISYEQELKIEE